MFSDFNKIEIFSKVYNIKFHENPFSGSRTDTCEHTDDHIYDETN
jgi:hypothetical protein